jgi:hypothetical protein
VGLLVGLVKLSGDASVFYDHGSRLRCLQRCYAVSRTPDESKHNVTGQALPDVEPRYSFWGQRTRTGDKHMKKTIILLVTHLAALGAGFAGGIFALPILMAPDAPSASAVAAVQSNSTWSGQFRRDLEDSDFLHWGEGEITVGRDAIALMGSLAPGPDYRLYLSSEFVETEAAFNALKVDMVQVGMVNTFENFIVPVPADIDPGNYNTVVIWCESFGQFITAAQYR